MLIDFMVPADWRTTQNWDGPPSRQLWVVRWATRDFAFSTALLLVWHLNTTPPELSLKSESPASEPSITRLFRLSHPPPAGNTSAPLDHTDGWWPKITVSQVSHIQHLFAYQNSQRSMSCIIACWWCFCPCRVRGAVSNHTAPLV